MDYNPQIIQLLNWRTQLDDTNLGQAMLNFVQSVVQLKKKTQAKHAPVKVSE